MKSRVNISSGAKWEDVVGYSRLVKVDDKIFVTGTVAVDDHGKVVGEGDPYKQTKFIIEKVKNILEKADASLENVVRTRMFVTNISKWEEIGKAHGEYFAKIKPATTMVEVSNLIDPKFLIEIEFDAIIEKENDE